MTEPGRDPLDETIEIFFDRSVDDDEVPLIGRDPPSLMSGAEDEGGGGRSEGDPASGGVPPVPPLGGSVQGSAAGSRQGSAAVFGQEAEREPAAPTQARSGRTLRVSQREPSGARGADDPQADASNVSRRRGHGGQDDERSLGASTIASDAGGVPPAPILGRPGQRDADGGSVRPSLQEGASGPRIQINMAAMLPSSNRALFSRTRDVPDYEIADEVGVVCPKNKRGSGRDLRYNRETATKSLEPPFGVTKHFVSSLDGEPDDGDQVKDMWIQDSYAMNLAKVEDLNHRLIMWDLKRIFLISTLVSGIVPSTMTNVLDLWNDDSVDLIESWEMITWEMAAYWQYSLNKRAGPDDRVSNEWAYLLIYNSCTTALRDQISIKYELLPPIFRGAITYCWILFHCLFAKSRDTTAALKKYLTFFAAKGLQRIRNESMVVAKREIMAVCKRLNSDGHLPTETTVDVLKGLQHCSVKAFRDLFALYQQEAIRAELQVGEAELWGCKDTMEQVEFIIRTAYDFYNNLTATNQWNVPKGHKMGAAVVGAVSRPCWNCEKDGCNAKTCPEPRNEERINKNKEEYLKKKRERQEAGGGRGPGRGGQAGRGRGPGRGSGAPNSNSEQQYTREKWGDQVRWMNGQPHVYCSRKHQGTVCGWTHTHSTKYHTAAMTPGFTLADLAKLSPNHQLLKARGEKPTNDDYKSTDSTSASSKSGATGGDAYGNLSRTQAQGLLTRLSRQAKGDEARDMAESLQKAMGLN